MTTTNSTATATDKPTSQSGPLWGTLGFVALLATSMTLAAMALHITGTGTGIAAVWPVNAIFLVVLLKRGRRDWPVIIGALAAGLCAAQLVSGASVARTLILSAANAAETTAIASMLTYRRPARLLSIPGFSRFAASSIAGCLFSTGLASLLMLLAGAPLGTAGMALWFCAHLLGMVLFASIAWSLLDRSRTSGSQAISLPVALAFLLLCAVSVGVFVQSDFPLLFLVPPALVAVAYISGIRGAAIGLILVAAISFPLTVAGHGPTAFMAGATITKELVLQAFLVTNAIMALGVGAAVSDRRRLVERLGRTQERLRMQMGQLTESLAKAGLAEKMSGVGHWALDPRTQVVFWSPQVYAIHGVTPEEFDPGYDDAVAFYVEEDREMVDRLVAHGIETGQSWQFEATLVRRSDGERRQVESFGECVLDSAGQVERVFGVFRDITEEKRLISDLADREHQFRMLAEFSTDIVVQFGLDGVITYASPSCKRLGVSQQEAIGMSTLDFVIEEDRGFAGEITAGLFTEHDPDRSVRREFRVRTVTGDIIWLEGNPTIIRDDQGNPQFVVSTFRDVTDRRAREEALAIARVEAEAASKAKADFLSNMSHEIRTPLNGIIGFTQLATKTGLDAKQAHYVENIAQAGHMLRHIVDDVLDFSKIEAGQMLLDPTRFELRTVITDVCELVDAARGRPTVALEVAFDASDDLTVISDETRLRQILVNLVSNGLKFTERGHVRVETRQEGRDVIITVTDTGPGIPAAMQDIVFEGFQQADSTISRKFGGSGLGLAISRSLAELMHGTLELESVEGEGATLTLTLPGVVTQPIKRSEHAARTPADRSVTGRIMVVDDVDLNLELIEMGLSQFGHEVKGVSSAAEALEELASGTPYDLVLMDIQMPVMDGMTAFRRIRADMPELQHMPVIALTAQALPQQVAAIRQAGFHDYVAKPVDLDALQRLVCNTIQDHAETTERDVEPASGSVHAEFSEYLRSMRPEFDRLLSASADDNSISAIASLASAMANAAEALDLEAVAIEARCLESAALSARGTNAPAIALKGKVEALYRSSGGEA